MSGMHALAAAGLWMIAAAALAPVQADEAAKPADETAGQGGAASGKQDGAAIDGNRLFAGTCGFCHSDGGRKAGKGPKLAGSKRSDEFIINRITNGKPGRMPAFGRTYSPEQIEQILAYIRSLQPE
jgi:mono/diheme cytochrome c family protein